MRKHVCVCVCVLSLPFLRPRQEKMGGGLSFLSPMSPWALLFLLLTSTGFMSHPISALVAPWTALTSPLTSLGPKVSSLIKLCPTLAPENLKPSCVPSPGVCFYSHEQHMSLSPLGVYQHPLLGHSCSTRKPLSHGCYGLNVVCPHKLSWRLGTNPM